MKIAIIGDYDETRPSHVATNKALYHAAAALSVEMDIQWISTPLLQDKRNTDTLADYYGIWGSAGNPDSPVGLVNGITFAREHSIPYLGT
jgi:CTP synthase (UTP-ammonia lyase)